MRNNSCLEYYLSLFGGIRNKINYLVYDSGNLKSIPDSDINPDDLMKFTFMAMVCDSGKDEYRWLLLKDQKDYVISKLNSKTWLDKLNILDVKPKEFYNSWIDFKLLKSGLVRYFTLTNKDTEYIIDFKEETYLIGKGYEADYAVQPLFYQLRSDYRNKLGLYGFDPFMEMESIWGFKGVSFYYIKFPKIENLCFIGIFPILCIDDKAFLDKADFIFSLVKNAVLGANLMKGIMDENIERLNESLLKTAIISILVDSYAHNISAHSLAALKWWFHVRSENIFNKKIDIRDIGEELSLKNSVIKNQNVEGRDDLKRIAIDTQKFFEDIGKKDSSNDNNYTSLMEMIHFFPTKKVDEYFTYQDFKSNEEFRIPIPVDYSIFHFLRFLRDKAGFWSGVTRDVNFGGESKNLYDVLWNNFASNTLYLGTIAHSEEINTIKIHVEIPGLDGKTEFAKIDLSLIKREENIANNSDFQNSEDEEYSKYRFLIPGDDHTKIREELCKDIYNVYFPGGIVGEHAFFTIIENTLRNIKHFKGSSNWRFIQSQGIDLFISINPVRLMNDIASKEKNHELFEIEIYLDHETNLYNSEKEESLVEELRKRTAEPVLNESGSPRLGGSSQDKICAAMLLNGTFRSVDKTINEDELIKKRNDFYCNSDSKEITDDDYISWVGFKGKPRNKSGEGILKKYFYLWKSELILMLNEENDLQNENINRFKFFQTLNWNLAKKAREQGVIRIINEKIEDEKTIYLKWLSKWIDTSPIKLNILKGDTLFNSFYITKNEFLFINKSEISDLKDSRMEVSIPNGFKGKNFHKITVEHNQSNDSLSIRNHGFFLEKIYGFSDYEIQITDFREENRESRGKKDNYQIHEANIDRVFDLIETIFTKIKIFDDRLYERFESKKADKKDSIKEQLNIEFFPEDENKWSKFKSNLKKRFDINFLILHLSFIEKIKKDNGKDGNYSEEEIKEFINSEINLNQGSTKVPKNFVLVITTGRGRVAFWENLDEDQKHFVTFKPIESLLSALEDALIFNDDFQIKYNICKVLFGS